MKKEKEGYIWRRKIFFSEEKKTEKKKKENIWSPERTKYGEGIGGRYLEKKNICSAGEKKKEGKYLEKEYIWSAEEKNNGKGKGGKYLEKENSLSKEKKEKEKIFRRGKMSRRRTHTNRQTLYHLLTG